MQQRDIIKDEIEQLGRVLGKLIANFFGLKADGNVREAIKITNSELQSNVDIDIDKLVHLEANELARYLDLRNFSDLHLDQLASYLYEVGLYEKSVGRISQKWFEATMRLLDIIGEKSDTITFARIDLLQSVKREIE